MAMQYIGARYVVKIYENKTDPSTATWDSNVNYEPLTLVTYNNGSYLSKKEVPASVGNPPTNPTYWVQTGFYNGQIVELQNAVTNLNRELATETQNRTDVDDILRTSISNLSSTTTAEINSLKAKDSALESAIGTETTQRTTADATLATQISTANTAIATETSARTTADANLQSQIDNIIAPSGEAPSAAEVENARIGANGVTYNTLGNAIRGQVTELDSFHINSKHNIDAILGYEDEFYFDFVQGNIASSTGEDESRVWACRTGLIKFTENTDILVDVESGYGRQYMIYDNTGTFIEYHNLSSTVHITDLTKQYRFKVTKTDESQIDIELAKTFITFRPTSKYMSIPAIVDHIDGYATNERASVLEYNDDTILGYNSTFRLYWEMGSLALSTGLEEDANWCIRTPEFLKFTQPTVIHFNPTEGYRTQYIVYDSEGTYVDYHNKSGDLLIADSDLNYLYKIRVATADTSEIDYDVAKTLVTFNPQNYASIPEIIASVIPANKPLTGKTIVCFGDSLTGNPVDPYGYTYKLAQATGATVINAGFGGTNMAEVDTRAVLSMSALADALASGDWSDQTSSGISITSGQPNAGGTAWQNTGINYVPSRLDTLADINWSNVDYITIFFGTNDWNDNVPLDNNNNKYDTETYKGAFRHSVETILAEYPNIKIIPVSPLWRWFTESTDSDNTPKATSGLYLYEYADALKEVAKEYHMNVIELYYKSGINKFNKSEYFYSNDGTHPNPYGNGCLAVKIGNEIAYGISE